MSKSNGSNDSKELSDSLVGGLRDDLVQNQDMALEKLDIRKESHS